MSGRGPAPSVVPVIDEERRERRRAIGGGAVGLLIAVLLVTRLAGHRLGLDLPDLDVPHVGLPHWLRWLGPVLGVGKLLFLVGLGALAVLGEWDRRRRRDGGSP